MHNQKQPLNQTQFSFEEPIFENPLQYEQEKPQLEQEIPKKSKKKLFIIIGILVAVFILIILAIVLLLMRGGEMIEDPLRRDPQPERELGPLEQRIEESRILLELADPTKQDLSYPPIDFQLRLDPKED